MKILRFLILFAFLAPSTSSAEPEDDHYSAIGEACIQTEKPNACMQAFGFKCSRSERPNHSVGAFGLGCNAVLSDGRYHFVQILNDNGGWSVEAQRTYMPETAEEYETEETAESDLSAQLRDEMQDHSMHVSGNVSSKSIDGSLLIDMGTRWHGIRLELRALCGVVVYGQFDEAIAAATQSGCEQALLKRIRMLSQSQSVSPYRAAGAAEIEWQRSSINLATGDLALVVDGRYSFPKGHKSCRMMFDCCSLVGAIYLNSCRVPNDSELQAVTSCLAEGLTTRTTEFVQCLRDGGVKMGCEDQADGSRICY